jgi:hypothetical protein
MIIERELLSKLVSMWFAAVWWSFGLGRSSHDEEVKAEELKS